MHLQTLKSWILPELLQTQISMCNFFFLTNVSLFSTFFQTQQQTLTNFFHYLESKLYIYTFASCVVCLYCLVFCLLLSLFVCLFACLFGCHVIIASVSSIFSFMYLHFLCSYELAFSTIIVLFVFLEIDISPNNLVLFIQFVLLLIHLLVHTCIILYIFLHIVVLRICTICLLFVFLFVCLHVYHDVSNALLNLCLFL